MKRIVILSVSVLFLLSANVVFAQGTMKAKPVAAQSAAAIVSPENFQDYAASNIGTEVEIKGMVVHVCKHGGKKLFIIGEDPDKRVKITASDKVSEFKPELEGSTIVVRGLVEPIEEEVVPEEEKATQDADHTNYYHKPQYAINCLTLRTVEE